MSRKIIHVDMDAFFASVEQRDQPEYRNLPLIVGGRPDSRGVVAACSYEARRFGIHSAMPCSRAARLCPDAIFVPPRFSVYKEVSRQIHAVFNEYTDRIEPLSLDEAYLDVTDCQQQQGSATRIAEAIRAKIYSSTALTASAGVSYNKFLAKTASDINKPNGLTVILPEEGERFIETLLIGDFYGVGQVTEKKMQSLGIYTGLDLRQQSMAFLQQHFGKSAGYYHQIARGQDHREVCNHRERKSLGAETTFQDDVVDEKILLERLNPLLERVCTELENKTLLAHTVTLKVKYHDFTQVTRSQSFQTPFSGFDDLLSLLPDLLRRTEAQTRPVRLIGVSLSGLISAQDNVPRQLSFFS